MAGSGLNLQPKWWELDIVAESGMNDMYIAVESIELLKCMDGDGGEKPYQRACQTRRYT